VEGEQSREPVGRPFVDEVERSSRKHFLGRLEDDPDIWMVVESGEDHRNASRDRGVGIVATGMHPTLCLRSGRVPGGLLDGKGVDVRPETHERCVTQVDPTAGLRSAACELETVAFDETSDQIGGSVFAVSRLGVSMQETTQFECLCSNLIHEPRQLIRAGHASTLTVAFH
jgi:hypothetical protein